MTINLSLTPTELKFICDAVEAQVCKMPEIGIKTRKAGLLLDQLRAASKCATKLSDLDDAEREIASYDDLPE